MWFKIDVVEFIEIKIFKSLNYKVGVENIF